VLLRQSIPARSCSLRNRTGLTFLITRESTASTAASKFFVFFCSSWIMSATVFMDSATMVLSTAIDVDILSELPRARNSNFAPVNANGEVRFRSEVSRMNLGRSPDAEVNGVELLDFFDFTLFDLVEDRSKLFAEEHAYDCRRGFVRAEPMLVAAVATEARSKSAW